MAKESTGVVVKRRLYGVLFLVIAVGLVSLSIAIYAKVFVKTTDVTLQLNQAGNQLLKDSDVKVRGLIVGSVKDINVNGDQVDVKLGLEPDKAKLIPRNVSAQILPKTLFGEQYVSLVLPQRSEGEIRAGDVIPQDRSKGALEAQVVFNNLLPVLTAVQPADLNATLTAIATALDGRGKKLGQTLVNADQYLSGLNPYTKELVDDLKKLGQVALEYDNVAPALFDSLSNLQTTVKTVVEKRRGIDELFTTGASTATVLRGFLADNRSRLIATVGQTAKIYPLLAEYSPEFPCLFSGVNKLANGLNKAIYDNAIHLSATVDVTNQGKYTPGQQPRLITGFGPNCFGLPDNPQPVDGNGNFQIPDKYKCLNDGAPLTTDPCGRTPSADAMRSMNSAAENALVNTLIAGDMGTTPKNVPATATILAAPLLRGNEVTVK